MKDIDLTATFTALESFLEDKGCEFDPRTGNPRETYENADYTFMDFRSYSRIAAEEPQALETPGIAYLNYLEKLGIET